MAIDWIRITLRLIPETYRKTLFISLKEKRSLNSQIEFGLQNMIKKYEEENGPINEREE